MSCGAGCGGLQEAKRLARGQSKLFWGGARCDGLQEAKRQARGQSKLFWGGARCGGLQEAKRLAREQSKLDRAAAKLQDKLDKREASEVQRWGWSHAAQGGIDLLQEKGQAHGFSLFVWAQPLLMRAHVCSMDPHAAPTHAPTHVHLSPPTHSPVCAHFCSMDHMLYGMRVCVCAQGSEGQQCRA